VCCVGGRRLSATSASLATSVPRRELIANSLRSSGTYRLKRRMIPQKTIVRIAPAPRFHQEAVGHL